nr:hypothetical protein [Tanacetum cinerariifolium]
KFATLVIQSTITKSLANVVLVKSSSQPKSTYEATASLTEFELKKILLDKMQKKAKWNSNIISKNVIKLSPIDLTRITLKDMNIHFDLRKPLLLIEDRRHQVVPINYFIKNNLEYLKGRSSSRKYTTSTTKTKAAKYDDIQGIEDMVPSLWSPAKFSDGTLTSVRFVLYDIASNLRIDYLPKKRCNKLDKQRSRIMIKAINKLQLDRRLMRNLEKFIGGREYEKDFKLLKRTI